MPTKNRRPSCPRRASLTKDEVAELQGVFRMFDKTHEGRITPDKLRVVLQAWGADPTEEELKDLINELDMNEDGTIDFNEFARMMTNKCDIQDEDEMKEAFMIFDINNDGYICRSELKQAMANLGEALDDGELEDMFTQADLDKDGKINYQEFVIMMNK